MNWKEAFRVLREGLPQPVTIEKAVEREVFVLGEPVELYAVAGAEMARSFNPYCGDFTLFPRFVDRSYHRTCAEAFAAAGIGDRVEKRKCYQHGDKFYKAASVEPITVEPKPKKAKGRG